MTWAVFLDRDGVLTEAPMVDGRAGSPSNADDLVLMPGAAAAVAELREQGPAIFVVTNQPDIARGNLTQAALDVMHDHLRAHLAVDEVRTCPHDGADACACRKPRPGMLVELARAHGIDLAESWIVGDRWVDIGAGRAAGVQTILVDRPYSWSGTSAGAPPPDLSPDYRVGDVAEAARLIARIRGSRRPVP